MGIRSVVTEDDNETNEELAEDLEVRKLARQIFARIWPDKSPSWKMIEEISNEVIVFSEDDDSIDKDATDDEIENLMESKKVASEMYEGCSDGNSPEAVMQAYKIEHTQTDFQRNVALLAALESLMAKGKGKR